MVFELRKLRDGYLRYFTDLKVEPIRLDTMVPPTRWAALRHAHALLAELDDSWPSDEAECVIAFAQGVLWASGD